MTQPEIPGKPSKKPSEAKIQSNRRNAQKSTGPRTEAGKAKSARNALKHGLFAANPMAIGRGPLEEDPNELVAFFDRLGESMAPRDAIEAEQARIIAATYLRLRRLDAYEALVLDGDGRFDDMTRMAIGDDEEVLDMEFDLLEQMSELLENPDPDPDEEGPFASGIHYRAYPRLLTTRKARLKIPGLWDESHEPRSSEEWQRAYAAMIQHWWPQAADMEEWLRSERMKVMVRRARIAGRWAEVAASKSLVTLDRTARLRRSALNELERTTLMLSLLQRRPLEGDVDDDGLG